MEDLKTPVISEQVAATKGAFAELDAVDTETTMWDSRRTTAEESYRVAYDALSSGDKPQLEAEQHELNAGFPGKAFGKYNK